MIGPAVFRALSHPTRAEVLVALQGGELSPVAFSRTHGVGLSAAAYHFAILAKSGLVVVVRTQQRRGATEHFYALTPLGQSAVMLAAGGVSDGR